MSRAAPLALLASLGTLAPIPVLAAGGPGFVPYDPASEGQVSGTLLLIAAYAVICGVLGLYALSLFLRTRSLARRAEHLRARVPGPAPADAPPG